MPVAPGSELPLQLQWDTIATPTRDWSWFIHLLNDQDEIVAQRDQRPWNGRWPTPVWLPNQPFWESTSLTIPPGLPPGSYDLRLGFYIGDERLPLAANSDQFLLLSGIITLQP
jgi:hypothetical protein